MPKGKFVGNEGTVALRGVVRDGKLVGIIDHEEKERGIVLTDVNEVTGVIELWAGDEQVTAGAAGADGVTFVSGTTAPNNADGRPDGTVYVRYAV